MTFDYAAYNAAQDRRIGTYHMASGAKGKRRFRVIYVYVPDGLAPGHAELHGKNGKTVIRFATYETAQHRADALNRLGARPARHPTTHQHVMPRLPKDPTE